MAINRWLSSIFKRILAELHHEGPGAPWLVFIVGLVVLMVVIIGIIIDARDITSVDININ